MDKVTLDRQTHRLLERQMHAVVKLAEEIERLNDNLEAMADETDGDDDSDRGVPEAVDEALQASLGGEDE